MDRIYGTMKINGVHCPVTNMFDIDGEETEDFSLVERIVCSMPDGGWVAMLATGDEIWLRQ